MTRRLLFSLLAVLLVVLPLMTSCNGTETTPTSSTTSTPTASTSTTTTTTASANWWDDMGEPQYGGSINYRVAGHVSNFDTFMLPGGEAELWLETLFQHDWALDRDTWSFQGAFVPDEYWVGHLAESWEQTDPTTITAHIRQGVHWQDIEPVNGREFTAYDVEAHYDRMLGIGDYTEPAPMYTTFTANWDSITATDDYTVVFKFKEPSITMFQSIADLVVLNAFEPPEVAAISPPGGNTDPKYAIGTGPWIFEEYVAGASLTCSRNPNYWGYDERYPENQLPYADEINILIIPEVATAIAGIRTGKIDIISGDTGQLTWQQAQNLAETNPELQQIKVIGGAQGVQPRNDTAPFTDIRVRKALQMAINREEIAQAYYGGMVDGKPIGWVTPVLIGYCYDYEDWPQELKDEYAYNPEKAKELLAEAAADGVFEVNEYGGFDTNVIASGSKHDVELMEILKAEFLDIGVDMEIQEMEIAALEAITAAGNHDQMAATIGGGTSASPSVGLTTFDSRDPRNYTFVNSSEYEALVDAFNAATSLEESQQIVRETDKLTVENHWYMVVCPTASFNVWQPYLKGYSGEGIHWGEGHTWARLWIDQDSE